MYEVSCLNIACRSSMVPAFPELPASSLPSSLVFTTSRLSQPMMLFTIDEP